MKFRKGLNLKNICGENVVVAEGLENINFSKMIVLNSTAKYLFEKVKDVEFTAEDLENLLLEKYEVSKDVVTKDVAKLCNDWQEAGLFD